MYHYAGNNPVRYIDPDGEFIFPLLCQQKQNSGSNLYAKVGHVMTYDSNDRVNSLGNFGCLFVAAVNIGNSYNMSNNPNYVEQQASLYSSNDSYFYFGKEDSLRDFGNLFAIDFVSDDARLEQLLKDMTDTDFSVETYSGSSKKFMLNLVRTYSDKGAYLIGKVKTPNGSFHFINITGFDSNGNMEYFDPYDYSRTAPVYNTSSLIDIKVVSERDIVDE